MKIKASAGADRVRRDAQVPDRLFDEPEPEARWRTRFTAPVVTPPVSARSVPDRSIYVSNASGTFQVHSWDRESGLRRQITHDRHGTLQCAISADGNWIWYFQDEAGSEHGRWWRARFPTTDADLHIEHAPIGALGTAVGRSVGSRYAVASLSAADGCDVWVYDAQDGAAARRAFHDDVLVMVHDMDPAESMVAVSRPVAGDLLHPEVLVLRLSDGATLARRWEDTAGGLEVIGFSPVEDDHRLLMAHERDGTRTPFIWDVTADIDVPVDADLSGETSARWYADGSALLLRSSCRGRTELHRHDLGSSDTSLLPVRTGWVGGASVRAAGGAVEYGWCDATTPVQIRVLHGTGVDEVLLTPGGGGAAPSRPLSEVFVPGPGGDVHVLYSAPSDTDRSWPTVFSIHGGPHFADEDFYDPNRAAWLDAGFAVVHVNYRGSTGYGRSWREAVSSGLPGHVALQDIAAAHDHAVRAGLAHPDRCVIRGWSWGGYLALLGLGLQPQRWAAGIAGAPIADLLAAYEQQSEALRSFDDALFGGSPEEVRDRYVESSPLTHAQRISAPVLLLSGVNDPRTPRGQVVNFENRLAELGKAFERYLFDGGHGSLDVDEQMRQVVTEISFARTHVDAC